MRVRTSLEARTSLVAVAFYKENKKPWDDCQACRFGQKAEIGQGLTIFILQGRPQRPVRNSLDHLVGEREQLGRDFEAEPLRGPEIDDKVELCGLHHRQFAWLFALQDSTDIDTSLSIGIRDAGAVGHKPAGKGILTKFIDCRYGMIRRERDQLLTSSIEERLTRHQEPAASQVQQPPKRCIDVALAARIQDQNLPADALAPRLHVLRLLLGVLAMGVD